MSAFSPLRLSRHGRDRCICCGQAKLKRPAPQKRTPGSLRAWGLLSRCLTYLGFWIGRQGCRGMGLPPNRPNAIQLGLLPLGYKLHLGNAAI